MCLSIRNTKRGMYGTNVILLIVGMVLWEIGREYSRILSSNQPILNSYYVLPVNILLIGVVVMILAVIGLTATATENLYFLLVHSSTLLVVFFVHLGMAISSITHGEEVQTNLNEDLANAFETYYTDYPMGSFVDEMQLFFHCCGADGPKFWETRFLESSFPSTCCDYPSCTFQTAYIRGCNEVIIKYIMDYITVAVGISFGVAMVEGAAVIFSFFLWRSLKERLPTISAI